MKRATIADAPAVLNTNDKAMWVLGFNAALDRVIEVKAREIYDTWKDQRGWVPWVLAGNSLMQDKARRIAADGVKEAPDA
jgi:hypothetical protein